MFVPLAPQGRPAVRVDAEVAEVSLTIQVIDQLWCHARASIAEDRGKRDTQ